MAELDPDFVPGSDGSSDDSADSDVVMVPRQRGSTAVAQVGRSFDSAEADTAGEADTATAALDEGMTDDVIRVHSARPVRQWSPQRILAACLDFIALEGSSGVEMVRLFGADGVVTLLPDRHPPVDEHVQAWLFDKLRCRGDLRWLQVRAPQRVWRVVSPAAVLSHTRLRPAVLPVSSDAIPHRPTRSNALPHRHKSSKLWM